MKPRLYPVPELSDKNSQTDSHEQVWLKFLNIIKLLNKVDAKIRRWDDISKFEEDFFDIRVKLVARKEICYMEFVRIVRLQGVRLYGLEVESVPI